MKGLLIASGLGVLVIVWACSTASATTVVNFDDMGSLLNADGAYWADEYACGELHATFGLMNETYFGTYYNEYGFPSSPIAAYANSQDDPADPWFNPAGHGRVFAEDSVFDFLGCKIGGSTLWGNVNWFGAPTVTIVGLRDGVEVDSITVAPRTGGFDWVGANFVGVDTVEFRATEQYYDYLNLGLFTNH